jgi:uracil-DNA glycosylase family 4
MKALIAAIRKCDICVNHLPLGARPIIEASANSKIVIVGQAPGRAVHETGIPWNDQSGKKLRSWLGVDEAIFYNVENFAIVPMGFCYPGKGKTGDLPPRKECAETWHQKVFSEFRNVELIVLVGKYAQDYFLFDDSRSLTEKVRSFADYLPKFWPIPHPSPVNRFWLSKNKWFETEVLPALQERIRELLLIQDQGAH